MRFSRFIGSLKIGSFSRSAARELVKRTGGAVQRQPKEVVMEINKNQTNNTNRGVGGKKSRIRNFFEVLILLVKAGMLFSSRRVWKSLLELNRETDFVADEARSVSIAKKIFSAFPEKFKAPWTRKIVLKGTVVSDVGKNGAVGGRNGHSKRIRRLIRRMYNVENVPDGHKLNVQTFMKGPYREKYGLSPEEVERDIRLFEKVPARDFPEAVKVSQGGVPLAENVSMPRFWSYGHVVWTGRTLFADDWGEIRSAALLHHILEGVVVYNALDRDGQVAFGVEFDYSHALVGVIDKYEAFRTRSGMDHEKAVSILRSMVEKSAESGGLSKLDLTDEARERIASSYYEAIDMLDVALK